MDRNHVDKLYESLKTPDSRDAQKNGVYSAWSQTKSISLAKNPFYEIEYDSSPIEGVGKYRLTPHKIEPPKKDEIRELFYRMRDISRNYGPSFTNYTKFYDKRVQQNNARIFYEQAIFMKDFEDNYPNQVTFSSYFPFYQQMGYEQLRTYFTWRTQVRKGNITNTSSSYVFLYIYELLNSVGVESPQDGLDKLMLLYVAFKLQDATISKYILQWVKDYHIYYDLPQSFKDFVATNGITDHYPKIASLDDSFELFSAISKYNIQKSAFYTEDTSKMITDCFHFCLDKIRQDFKTAGMHFDDALFKPSKKITIWKPFRDALFHQCQKLPDKRVIMSENEIYIRKNNEWTTSTTITSEKGRQFIGFMMKKMESILRKVTKYKYKTTANIDMVSPKTLKRLTKSGINIEDSIQMAVLQFYREATKTVVTVDHTSLARIREEALVTQESLIVEDEAVKPARLKENHDIFQDDNSQKETSTKPVSDSWSDLKNKLNHNELCALKVILQGKCIKQFADDNNIMLEILADSINVKAMDYIGDNLLDDEFIIYEDYEAHIKRMTESL